MVIIKTIYWIFNCSLSLTCYLLSDEAPSLPPHLRLKYEDYSSLEKLNQKKAVTCVFLNDADYDTGDGHNHGQGDSSGDSGLDWEKCF